MSSILTVNSLVKSFNHYENEILRIASWFGIKTKSSKQYDILKEISFSVEKGKAVGIVGKNGAGKSTLLKIITGTLSPSSGNVDIRGSVSAILELGMGFNPELTGRENVFHASGLMGHSYKAVLDSIEGIENFADIGEFFYQPVRTYSSGMQARLAFAVATAFRPDLLIVDEALSVGDVSFQAKCFQHMLKMKEAGTAILLVSHDAQAIFNFCDSAILLHEGKVALQGETKAVLQTYEKLLDNYIPSPDAGSENLSQSKVKLISYSLLDEKSHEISSAYSGQRLKLNFSFKCYEDIEDPHFGIRVADRFGGSLFETNTYCMGLKYQPLISNTEVTVEFEFDANLACGSYLIDIAMVNKGFNGRFFKESLSMNHNVITLKIYENNNDIVFGGVTNLKPKVKMNIE
ncbi:ABC transporter ATP-binding protein [Vibrio ruber]|uniref:ABC transporter ATP-binding protein n=1 Tax=Vibrio ruber TaxID=184755 RepID=UPI002893105C|nr:ABC transporter ATP-binding protein [Vibrio ruber]WNJ96499.1 ABC transporter ATP-binding protein [Vibrio ruber]